MTASDDVGYFESEAAARGWLDFECDPKDMEDRFYAESERYEEWFLWRQAWLMELLENPSI